jgi:16S rRNA C967 or C1407 C5-methylase (RsmB/RsmF family)/NOL1/NOP2/fmu family ribosome biogenesis protein
MSKSRQSVELPVAFLSSLEGIPGYDREAFLAAHEHGAAGASVRLNADKLQPGWLEEANSGLPPVFFGGQSAAAQTRAAANEAATVALPAPTLRPDPVPWCSQGFSLQQRPAFVFDPLFHAGAYYVQEASSMFLDYAWTIACGDLEQARVLDLCAAPGGKSTLLAAKKNIALLLSNELIRSRVPVLYENVVKWGIPAMLVSNQDPKDFQSLPGFFDVMVVDAPCSGSGLFRKDAEAVMQWSPQNVIHCSQRQQRILADALPCLREDGILIYATCSYSREEDEAVCDWLMESMAMESIRLPIPEGWGVVESISEKHAYGYRFYPYLVRGEGFFLAAFRKKSASDGLQVRSVAVEKPSPVESATLRSWLQEPDTFRIFKMTDTMLAFPEEQWEGWLAIAARFRLRRSGLRMGAFAHGDFNPDHELAMSTFLEPGVDSISLNLDQSLRYLRRETLDIQGGVKGWICLRYEGLSLGFGKRLPNRLNNYYPSEWRIRMDNRGAII